jgi:hydroxymethylpyrimidine/phosphomethylpyrimidine kinase
MSPTNVTVSKKMPAVLTIAGSDSSGGAGIQADLKTFSALNVFGTSAITCVTAQNPAAVTGVAPVETDLIVKQIRAVCDAFPVAAAKTGMLYSAEIIRAVAREDVREGIPILVVDPVMVAASGARLLQEDAVEALCRDLLPEARVITPNLHEAEILCGWPIRTEEDLRRAAREIGQRYNVACVTKGGHLDGDTVIDVLFDEGDEYVFTAARLPAPETHGAGCAFSAALTAFLARGELLCGAVERAKRFIWQAFQGAVAVGRHHPLRLCGHSDVD